MKQIKKMMAVVMTLVVGTAMADAVDWSQYSHSFSIAFPGYSGSETLTDFPVLVKLSAELNNFQYSECKLANGGDLRFSDSEGNLLSHEIDTWNPSGVSLVWVKVPSFNARTVIKAYYGNATPAAVTASDVWSNGYKAIWHLNESGITLVNSVAGRADLEVWLWGAKSSTAQSVVREQPGILGNAVSFGSPSRYGALCSTNDTVLLSGAGSFTVELWAFQDHHAPAEAPGESYLFNEHDKIVAITEESGGKIQTRGVFTGASLEFKGDYLPPSNEWNHIAFAYDSSSGAVNVQNGTTVATKPAYGSLTSSAGQIFIGNYHSGGPNSWIGKIDEVRISSVARSADWLKASHDCVAEDNFASYALLENDWAKYSHKFNVSFTGYAGSETLTNFPVLVRVSENSPSGFHYADCRRENGDDLRFADSDGNLLASEVDTWNPSGTSLVWVQVPSLTASTKITAYYGCPFAQFVNAPDVWTNGYKAIWHLNEGGLTMANSVAGNADLEVWRIGEKATKAIASVVPEQPGVLGNAVAFGRGDKYGALSTTNDTVLLGGAGSFTVELWAFQDHHDPAATSSEAVLFEEFDGVLAWGRKDAVEIAEQSGGKVVTKCVCTAGVVPEWAGDYLPPRNEWNHFAFAYDSSSKGINVQNGTVVKAKSASGWGSLVSNPGRQIFVGNSTAASTDSWPGNIDEVRISSVARSADWLKASHDTVKSASFAIYGAARENVQTGMMIIYR